MNKKTSRLIIIALIVIAIIFVIVKITSPKEDEDKQESYISRQSNGTIVNTSPKLAAKKEYKGLEFTNIKFALSESVTNLTATVKNTTSKAMETQIIDINVLDKDGTVMTTFVGQINGLEPGEETTINSGIAADYAGAYNVEFISPEENRARKVQQEDSVKNEVNNNEV